MIVKASKAHKHLKKKNNDQGFWKKLLKDCEYYYFQYPEEFPSPPAINEKVKPDYVDGGFVNEGFNRQKTQQDSHNQ